MTYNIDSKELTVFEGIFYQARIYIDLKKRVYKTNV